MKFLCVPCDQPMTLASVRPPDRGSLSVLYACPDCGYEMAMLTNAHETQLVTSLGVKIGPSGAGGDLAVRARAAGEAGPSGVASTTTDDTADAGTAATLDATKTGTAAERALAGGCPFAGMVAEMEAASTPTSEGGPVWTDAATERLDAIPEFVRPMARSGIEKFARERGYARIDESVLEEARAAFGM